MFCAVIILDGVGLSLESHQRPLNRIFGQTFFDGRSRVFFSQRICGDPLMNPLSLELGIHLGVRRDANMCLRRQTEVDTLTDSLDRVMIAWKPPVFDRSSYAFSQ
jgi:hypothetical protein